MISYISLREPFFYETTIRKSRFLVDLVPAASEDEARAALAAIRKREYSATHCCSAYRIGAETPLEHSSDDGEPSGTAGRPMLATLRHRGLTQCLAVVTRYFGGIKLGTGGLVRAYGGTLADAIARAPLVAYEPHLRYIVTLPYDLLGAVEHDWSERPYRIADRGFAAAVELTVDVPSERTDEFLRRLNDVTAARATVKKQTEALIPFPYTLPAENAETD